MIYQEILVVLLPILIGILGWWATTTWRAVKDMERSIAELNLNILKTYRTREEGDVVVRDLYDRIERLSNLELLLARSYVTKGEIKELFSEFVDKLNKIQDKLDSKVDKDK